MAAKMAPSLAFDLQDQQLDSIPPRRRRRRIDGLFKHTLAHRAYRQDPLFGMDPSAHYSPGSGTAQSSLSQINCHKSLVCHVRLFDYQNSKQLFDDTFQGQAQDPHRHRLHLRRRQPRETPAGTRSTYQGATNPYRRNSMAASPSPLCPSLAASPPTSLANYLRALALQTVDRPMVLAVAALRLTRVALAASQIQLDIKRTRPGRSTARSSPSRTLDQLAGSDVVQQDHRYRLAMLHSFAHPLAYAV